MLYQAIWIEGESALEDFCRKELKDHPRFIETIGHCGSATIWLKYKRDNAGNFHRVFLVFRQHPSGHWTFDDLQAQSLQSYEQLKINSI